jgi:hypothetical protein
VLNVIKQWRQSRPANNLELGIPSSASSVTSFELIRAFNYLDNNSIMIMDAEPVNINTQFLAQTSNPAQRMPLVFNNLEEARAHLALFISQTLHWIASAYAWSNEKETKY